MDIVFSEKDSHEEFMKKKRRLLSWTLQSMMVGETRNLDGDHEGLSVSFALYEE